MKHESINNNDDDDELLPLNNLHINFIIIAIIIIPRPQWMYYHL